jgi:hypothetical protein
MQILDRPVRALLACAAAPVRCPWPAVPRREALILSQPHRSISSGAKAHLQFAAFMARLQSLAKKSRVFPGLKSETTSSCRICKRLSAFSLSRPCRDEAATWMGHAIMVKIQAAVCVVAFPSPQVRGSFTPATKTCRPPCNERRPRTSGHPRWWVVRREVTRGGLRCRGRRFRMCMVARSSL